MTRKTGHSTHIPKCSSFGNLGKFRESLPWQRLFFIKVTYCRAKKTFFGDAVLKNTFWSYVSKQWYALFFEAMGSISNLGRSHAVGN